MTRRIFSLALTGALIVLSVGRIPASTTLIVMEAENFARIDPPMKRSQGSGEASNNAWVELPLGCGQGWRGLGSGSVTYRLSLPEGGSYVLWARTRWRDGCTNAFFLAANSEPKVIVGNDAIFGQWHWVKSVPLSLHEGINYLNFSNHSDGTCLDKIVLTNNPLYLPDGLGENITQFYDGFAGCDADNTGSWEFSSGVWHIVSGVASDTAGANDCLVQWDEHGGVALAGYPNWQNYHGQVKMMFAGPATAGLIFARTQDSELRILCSIRDGKATLHAEKLVAGKTLSLGVAAVSGQYDHWYTLGFKCVAQQLQVLWDEQPVLSIEYPQTICGQIGLATVKSGGIYFDNVDIHFDNKAAHDYRLDRHNADSTALPASACSL